MGLRLQAESSAIGFRIRLSFERDVLYPLASQNVAIDLDDGVKANYPKFGTALRKIIGLEATE